MDNQLVITAPIQRELNDFIAMFNQALTHPDGLLGQALSHIRNRGGKRMRPILVLLMAKNYGVVNEATLHSAVGLELLHTASLVHDDVVDEAQERRGQQSVNACYDNKVAVLVGDYVLSTALFHVSMTHQEAIFREIAELGRALANGEILQLTNTDENGLSEEKYFQVIENKTSALFESCCIIGALSAGLTMNDIQEVRRFGSIIGTIFQIRDDIFDYYDSKEIGKPTGNDMAEGKLTLPVLYALNHTDDAAMQSLAKKVKNGTVTPDEIATLVSFTKARGGIDYAMQKMDELAAEGLEFIRKSVKPELQDAFTAYLEYVIQRKN
ncbi:MAG: polyprenyl synthetase family protein [Prevotella sp.]|nr:polyprenyl synthetase family protein [Prevotella sp.]